MSIALAHFLVGAVVGTVASPDKEHRAPAMVLCGVWAMVPDLEKFLPFGVLEWLHDSAWANVFFGHRAMDLMDPADNPAVAIIPLAALLLVLVRQEAAD